MKKIPALFFLLTLFLAAITPVKAQTRGEGVGALLSNSEGDTTASITDCKTAPWAEVIIENAAEEIQAVAELDEKGLINFTFEPLTADLGSLYIYAVDEIGVTKKVLISGTSFINQILPPTIISTDEGLIPENSLRVTGFSHPGATVRVKLTSDLGYDNTFVALADSVTGSWEATTELLEPGSYTAVATATLDNQTSQESQELHFEIPAEGILENIGDAIIDIFGVISNAVQNLPNLVKQIIDASSKAIIPLALITLLLQGGIASLKDLLLFFNQYLVALLRTPLFPLLGKKRKKRPWGVLYDAVTKQPVAQGIVRLIDRAGKRLEVEVTDPNGVFSFFAKEGTYLLEALKAGYVFPSQVVTGSRDGEYENVYREGEIKVVGEQPTVNLSVPVDPREAKSVTVNRVKTLLRKHGPVFNLSLLVGGMLLSSIAYLAIPEFYNQLITAFYIVMVTILAVSILKEQRTLGIIKDEDDKPLTGVALSLVEAESGRLIKRRVSNERGRYQFVASRGEYKILISSVDWERIDKGRYYKGESLVVSKETDLVIPTIAVKKKLETALKRREVI